MKKLIGLIAMALIAASVFAKGFDESKLARMKEIALEAQMEAANQLSKCGVDISKNSKLVATEAERLCMKNDEFKQLVEEYEQWNKEFIKEVAQKGKEASERVLK